MRVMSGMSPSVWASGRKSSGWTSPCFVARVPVAHALVRVDQAHQRLAADHPPVPEVDHRLVVDDESVAR